MNRHANALVAAALIAACAGARPSAQVFDPALRFRTLSTDHFVIHFHQGEAPLATRLAAIAEETWRALQQPFEVTPPRRTHVVLADQTELFNGYATSVPYDTVVLYAVTPSGSDAEFNEWLRVLFTHEFTHIVHLDRSEGWARVVRHMFGRMPLAFPNLFLPPWEIEGLATYQESAITGEGRLHAGDFRAIVDEAARQDRLEPLDRINGGLTDWPGAAGIYAYGVGFHQYLADRFGPQTLAALAEATARRVPYAASPAFKHIYGESLGDLWRDYERSLLAAEPPSATADAGLTRLTHQGFGISAPRFDRYACVGCALSVLYSAVNPHGFPALYRVGTDGGSPRQITTRYLGSTTAPGPDTIYFDQLELRRNTGLYSDLYAFSRADGHVRQITRNARVLDPDLSPDGETLVAVQNQTGQRDLVTVRLKPDPTGGRGPHPPGGRGPHPTGGPPPTGGYVGSGFSRTYITTLIAEAGTQFDAPKWSPDGRTIAVERHRLGSTPEIVLVDVATRAVRVLAANPNMRFVTPAWRPDGAAVVAAVAAYEETFNLFEFPLDGSPARQITHSTGGALWPDVSPDGETIVFAGYTVNGYDVFAMPYPVQATQSDVVQIVRPAGADASTPDLTAGVAVAGAVDYNPLGTLAPTSWTPYFAGDSDQFRVGAAIAGADVLGYHGYAATATWLVSAPDGAPVPNRTMPDWQLSYVYNRWRPTMYVSAAADTSFLALAASDTDTLARATRRERQIEAGVIVPFRRVRVQHAARVSLTHAVADFFVAGESFSRDRTPLRGAWNILTARTYGYSISRERGIWAGVGGELVRRAFASSGDATTTTADVRAYLPGAAPHHVVAVRLGGGRSSGDPTVGRVFLLGGPSPGDSVVDTGGSAFSLLRGFEPDTFAGTRVAVANVEYRVPIARPQRGYGTWPLFLQSMHAALFADAGEVWTRTFEASAIKSSAGAQLSADLLAGFAVPFTISAGAAWGHDGSGTVPDRLTAYFRVGKAF